MTRAADSARARPAPRVAAALLLCVLLAPVAAVAQTVITRPERVISVARGRSALLVHPQVLQRLAIADSSIAEAVVVSPREVLINGKGLGTTSLLIWDNSGAPKLYNVAVTVDVEALERTLRTIFPADQATVTATGDVVTLSGRMGSALAARRAVEIARTTGATVVDNLAAPSAEQVLLQVRFAEVSRNALERLGTEFQAGQFEGRAGDLQILARTASEGLVRLFLLEDQIQAEALIRALRSRGVFRSLAEPNLLALPGQEASFLAGGEFPFPVVQGGQFDAVTIQWKEFGVRLRFTPVITNSGTIRLKVAPEVSSLNFADGLQLQGFQIPSIQTRRASTEVELLEGQYLVIAGLLNNVINRNVSRIPILGDIPLLGRLFRSRDERQEQTELLVLVTPRLVRPIDTPPPLPTGEPETWDWDRSLRRPGTPPGPQQQ